jgi:hypothetical protein
VADSAGSAWSGTLRTIFLDRDGVLNEKMPEGSYVTAWADFRMLPGVPEAIARLNQAGLRVIVVSNQRGIALGLYSAADVAAIHAKLQDVPQGERRRMWMPSISARTTKGNATAASRCRACLSRQARFPGHHRVDQCDGWRFPFGHRIRKAAWDADGFDFEGGASSAKLAPRKLRSWPMADLLRCRML